MIVYSDGGSVADGYYFWDGSKWVALLTSAITRSNHVIVKSESDFPAAVSGIITLAANTTYEINGNVAVTKKINLNNAIVKGAGGAFDILNYTPSSGELFTGANGGSIKQLVLMAPNTGAKVFNLDAGGGAQNLVIEACRMLGCANIGNIKGYGGTVYINTIALQSNVNGFTFENITNLIILNTLWDSNNHGTFEKYVGTFNVIQKANGDMLPTAANSATAIDVSGITSLNAGELKNTLFVGTGTYVTGTFSKYWEVEAQGLVTQKDAVASGNLYISTPVATTFTAGNTPTKILGTTTAVNTYRVTSSGNNRLVYDGSKSRKFTVTSQLTLTSLSNNKYYSFYIAKNGVILPESKQTRKMATGNDQGEMGLQCIVDLQPGDYIEVWVANDNDNTGITVHTMNLILR